MNKMSEETRREANEKVDKTKREIQVLQILSEYKELTAKQIARYMAYRNYTKEIDYNMDYIKKAKNWDEFMEKISVEFNQYNFKE